MKRFAALMLLLSIGLFTIGCAKPADEAAAPAEHPAAEADADAGDGSEAKTEETTE